MFNPTILNSLLDSFMSKSAKPTDEDHQLVKALKDHPKFGPEIESKVTRAILLASMSGMPERVLSVLFCAGFTIGYEIGQQMMSDSTLASMDAANHDIL